MNQCDIFNFLEREYKNGNTKYFTITELYVVFNEYSLLSLRRKVLKLYAFGYLDKKIFGLVIAYRVKPNLIDKDYNFLSPLSKDIDFAQAKDLSQ